MKLTRLASLFIILACSVLWLGNKDGRANGGNEGATGAPNDNPTNRTCQNCHNGSSSIQVSLDIEMLNPNQQIVTSYIPGEIYTLRVRLNSHGTAQPSAYGFQLVALNGNLTPVNAWLNPGPGIQTTTLSNGRAYAEHLTPSVDNVFEVSWTAPAENTGDVTFYSCGNGVNGNNQSSGDGAAINQLTVIEGTGTVSASEQLKSLSLDLYPVPASDYLILELPASLSGNVVVRIIDLAGKERIQTQAFLEQKEKTEINVERLPAGIYLLQVVSSGINLSKQFIKQ